MKITRMIVIGLLACVLVLVGVGVAKRFFFNEPVPRLFGHGAAVIVGGSMEPTISYGDMVVVRAQDSYQVGDIVTFKSWSGNSVVTHRIQEVTPAGYITQGDANNGRDPEVSATQVIGRVIHNVEGFGSTILFFQTPLGILALIAALVFFTEGPYYYKKWVHADGTFPELESQ